MKQKRIAISQKRKAADECGPKDAKATKWGEWKFVEADAETSAYEKARGAAGRACNGDCGGDQRCRYTEASAELTDTETRVNQAGQTEFRCKVVSQGTCSCR